MADADDVNKLGGQREKNTAVHIAKVEELRSCAPFIKNVVKTYGRQLAQEQYRKLNMLVELLESEMPAEDFYRRFPEEKLSKIEGVIDKLKAKFGALLNPSEIIVIDAAEPNELPSTSMAAVEVVSKSNPSAIKTADKVVTANGTSPSSRLDDVHRPSPAAAKSSTGFERRSNPPMLSASLNADMSSPPAAKADFERRAQPAANLTVDLTSPIGSRRQDFTRRTNQLTVTTTTPPPAVANVSSPQARSPLIVFERRSNPPARSVEAAANSEAEQSKLKSLEEARKKLAALRGNSETVAPQLASNCNDPRGRKAIYANNRLEQRSRSSSLSPPPPPPALPTRTFPTAGRSQTRPPAMVNIPRAAVAAPPAAQHNIPTPLLRTRAPLNLNTSAAVAAAAAAAAAAASAEFQCSPNEPLQEFTEMRRYNNTELRDARDPRCNKWVNNNNNINVPLLANPTGVQQPGGPAAAGANHQYPGAVRRPAPYKDVPYAGFEDAPPGPNWQAANKNNNNNYSYNNNNSWSNNNHNNNNNNVYNKPNTSFSYRGGFHRGVGHNGNPRFPPPTATAVHAEPRTYREHREAKAAAAKLQAEKQRQLEAAEKQRQIEHETPTGPKQATVDGDRVQLDTSYRDVAGTATNKKLDFKIPKKVHAADKSCGESRGETRGQKADRTNRSNEVQAEEEEEEENCNDIDVEQETCTTKGINGESNKAHKKATDRLNKVNKADKMNKKDKPDKLDKATDKIMDTVDKSDKVAKPDKANKSIKADKADKTEILGKTDKTDQLLDSTDKADKSNKMDKTDKLDKKHKSDKEHVKRDKSKHRDKKGEMDKDKRAQKKDKANADKPKDKEEKEKEAKKPDNTDNVENEPPETSEKRAEPDEQPERRKTKGSSKMPEQEDGVEQEQLEPELEADNEDAIVDVEHLSEETNSEPKEANKKDEAELMPKLPKLKVVLGPNAHTITIIPRYENNDEPKAEAAKTVTEPETELKRIMKRRKSMMPLASKPLVDKSELFTGNSFVYEDIVEHQRQQQEQTEKQAEEEMSEEASDINASRRANRHLANMFEKTNDNCSISTHNILAGKRRSCFNNLAMNETQLSRNVFGLAPGVKTKPKAKPKEQAPTTAAKRKRGRPSKAATEEREQQPEQQQQQQEEEKPEPELPPAKRVCNEPATALPPPRRKPKRSELDKLNEDIAHMYYADDVMRATGRRACTAQKQKQQRQQKQLAENGASSLRSRSSSGSFASHAELAPFIRNVARRGRRFGGVASGPDRASFKAKKQLQLAEHTKRCLVRLSRCAQLEQLLRQKKQKQQTTTTTTKKRSSTKASAASSSSPIKNINPSWHAMSTALSSCVICAKLLRFPLLHYVQHHEEHFGSRLPPGILQQLRTGQDNRPIYGLSLPSVQGVRYGYKCPFCRKHLQLNNPSWVEHFARHTGEPNFQCSRCKVPRHRLNEIERHVAGCGAGARVIVNNNYSCRLPVRIHVCHLCDFVQLNRQNLERHWKHQHAFTDEPLAGLGQKLVIYHTAGVPIVKSQALAKNLLRRHNAQANEAGKAKASKKNNKKKQKQQQQQQKPKQPTKVEPEAQLDDENSSACVDVLTMPPPTLPEEDQLLVLNECKLEQEEEQRQQQQQVEHHQHVEPEIGPEQLQLQPDDNLSGIGSDGSDNEKDHDEGMNTPKQRDEWIDVECGSGSVQRQKSIFRNFHKFCSKLGNGSPASKTSSKSTKSAASSCCDGDVADLDSVQMPAQATTPTPTLTTSTSTLTQQFSVENVAYRLRPTSEQQQEPQPAYYCKQPGCTFLFSNELEGLENHFTREHPLVRWSGHCASCTEQTQPQQELQLEQQLTISAELQHLVSRHMAVPAAAQAEPVLPKLRVRRFTGDRLAAEPEALPTTAQLEPELDPELDLELMQFSQAHTNTMLRELLVAEPRPPSQPQMEPSELPAAAPILKPTVVNHASELGLAINQVYSLAEGVPPQLAGETLPLPAVTNGRYVLTQNVPQHSAAEINITIEPQQPQETPESVAKWRSKRLVADRFRCMAPNCNFCAHTVLCIREHMKFHCYSFGSKDYLQCAYCPHIGRDVDDFVHHGVIEHGLASRSELQESNVSPSTPTTAASVSQRIRDLLNQRNGPSSTTATTTATVSLASTAVDATVPPSTYFGALRDTNTPISSVLEELLKNTGYDDNKLYACPFKACSVPLTEDAFVNHVLFHMASNPNIGALTCKFCRQTFERPPSLRTHLQQMHARHNYFCSICLETTTNRRLMHQHLSSQHAEEYRLVNCQQQFIELPTQPEDQPEHGSVLAKRWVCAVEQPFGKKQMEDFVNKLLDEWLCRRQGTKTIYRPSELSLLPRQRTFAQMMTCGECQFQSQEYKHLHNHLQQHREQAVIVAYHAKPTTKQPAATSTISETANNTPAEPASSTNAPANEHETPGSRVPRIPKWSYVPRAERFVCCIAECRVHLATESALRQHFMTEHSYEQLYKCFHCQAEDKLTSLDKLLEHYAYHKRFIYQCGLCAAFHPKRLSIERHIQRHIGQNVDLVIHRRSDSSLNSDIRWIKSSLGLRTNPDDWLCNLCTTVVASQSQILAHMAQVHGRKHQFSCPFCTVCDKDVTTMMQHMRREHPDKRVQPIKNYQRCKMKNWHTLGFYCNSCDAAANSYQRMRKHCESRHKVGFQFKCPHCTHGHALERVIITHMHENHSGKEGLVHQQFERVANEMPDDDYWAMAHPFDGTTSSNNSTSCNNNNNNNNNDNSNNNKTCTVSNNSSFPNEPTIIDEIELFSSDEETYEQRTYEFTCSHCNETSSDVVELRTQHWAEKHAEHPFYFSVQPQLRCPECRNFVGNAKSLLENHLPNVHSIRNLVACDVNKPNECAFCHHRYQGWLGLAQHMVTEAHLSNDLKSLKDRELNELLKLGAISRERQSRESPGEYPNEYYQCNMCRVIMPTNVAMAQHGRVEHSASPERFCFRQVKDLVIFHCSFCMFASTTEMETLRHMLDHYKKFRHCHFCQAIQIDGFDEYIQHCYTFHRDAVHRFQQVHPYTDLKKFLMQVLYQFQNGLIISKSSLRRTRFQDERSMLKLYTELMRKAQQPPIPRLLISQLLNRNVTATVSSNGRQLEQQLVAASAKLTKRRKTLNPDDLNARLNVTPGVPQQQAQANSRSSVINWHTSFTGNQAASAAAAPAVATPTSTQSAASTSTPPMPNLERILKRRSTFVDIGQLATTPGLKRGCPPDRDA